MALAYPQSQRQTLSPNLLFKMATKLSYSASLKYVQMAKTLAGRNAIRRSKFTMIKTLEGAGVKSLSQTLQKFKATTWFAEMEKARADNPLMEGPRTSDAKPAAKPPTELPYRIPTFRNPDPPMEPTP